MGQNGTNFFRETVGVDLMDGAGAGEKYGEVTIEGRGGGASYIGPGAGACSQ